MSKKVRVTKAEKTAAGMIVERSAKSGRFVRAGVAKIANASHSSNSKSVGSKSVASTALSQKA